MLNVERRDVEIRPDPTRVVAKPFVPGESAFAGGPSRAELIADRVMKLTDDEVTKLLDETVERFAGRHRDLVRTWEANADTARGLVPGLEAVNGARRHLLGAVFTQEYAPGAAAICNPSIVQSPEGGGRFVLSVRSIGEGHISSVEFRTGHVARDGSVQLDPPSPYLTTGTRRTPRYERRAFEGRLVDLGADSMLTGRLVADLGERFGYGELQGALEVLRRSDVSEAAVFETARLAHWFASSNYELVFSESMPLSERILIPAGPADSQGIEDARFVRFVDDDGTTTYYATYTAFDGFTILPQLIETTDFVTFRIATLGGACARNKGMALFPRKIEGQYVALGRHDLENLHVLRSDDIRTWSNAELIYGPGRGWELVQIGNCGSPIETEHGWLVLTHGVGPMRTYAIGALLLHLDDPSRVIGDLGSPLLEPAEDERNGYVPNVVYSCGAIVEDGTVVIPYGFSDQAIHVATVDLEELIAAMT